MKKKEQASSPAEACNPGCLGNRGRKTQFQEQPRQLSESLRQKKKANLGGQCSLVVKKISSMCQALGSLLRTATTKKNKQIHWIPAHWGA